MKEKSFKKCKSCGATIKVIKDCECDNCGIMCCDKEMDILTPQKERSSLDKHIPRIKKDENEITITMEHAMDDDHYITFISYVGDDFEFTKYFVPGDNIHLVLPYQKGAKVYAHCNKHELWVKEV